MTTPDVNGQADEQTARTVPIKLPNGRTWPMPAWMASEMIERMMANETPAWARQRLALESGAEPPRPGRKPGSTASV